MTKTMEYLLAKAGRSEIRAGKRREKFYSEIAALFPGKGWINQFMKLKTKKKYFSSTEYVEQAIWQHNKELAMIKFLFHKI